jgi:CDP-paratose 2-epimerase
MRKALVTGCNGLIGTESVLRFLDLGYFVVGIDNNARGVFFGSEGSTSRDIVSHTNFQYINADLGNIYHLGLSYFDVVIHTAAQPAHDYANKYPDVDFIANVVNTQKLLSWVYNYCPNAILIHLSTTKVYSALINLTTEELDTRYTGTLINEEVPIEGAHGIFGADKLAADIIAQEYASYYGMNIAVFRPGCITGKNHKGVREHGFLSYLVKCIREDIPYIINGLKGKQVRDQLHVEDLVSAFIEVIQNPRSEVYNIGGGEANSVSVLEAISLVEAKLNKKAVYSIKDARVADHLYNVHDNSKFLAHYPGWEIKYDLDKILQDLL